MSSVDRVLGLVFLVMVLSGCITTSDNKSRNELADDFCEGWDFECPTIWCARICFNEDDNLARRFDCNYKWQRCYWID